VHSECGSAWEAKPIAARTPERTHFDYVRVPANGLVGGEHDGFREVFHGLNPERITGAAVCVGVGRHAVTMGADPTAPNRTSQQ
jgi:alkylation response protein AidB-like acyl-CoA dehydrogenase